MRSKIILLFLILSFLFIACEKDKDPVYRIKNDLIFENYFQIRQYNNGLSTIITDSIYVETGTATDYKSIAEGNYAVAIVGDSLIYVGFSPKKNKKYTIQWSGDSIYVGSVLEP
jgi:hypothetical protein